jgi:hypothetical protein
MVAIKEMSFAEKYAHALEFTKLLNTFVPPLLRAHLAKKGSGNSKVHGRRLWSQFQMVFQTKQGMR